MLVGHLHNAFQVILIFAAVLLCGEGKKRGIKKPRSLRVSGKCKPNIMAEYDLTFYGDWTTIKFPRMYPRYRPPAQWSNLIGRSHDSSYQMWSMNSYATPQIKSFAEEADASGFEQEAQAYKGILDTFTAAPIPSGAGKSSLHFFADGIRSKLSFLVKIIPSPDWIVGLASFNLCERGRWRKKVNVDLFPIDVGTDQGLAFSSPNWPSDPPEKIYQLDVNKPNHKASSFYYPGKKTLPRIAYVEIKKVAEFKRKGKTQMSAPIEANMIVFGDYDAGGQKSNATTIQADSQIQTHPLRDSNINDIAASYVNTAKDDVIEREDKCIVSEWGPWSPCSKTCGFGHQERRREIKQRARDRRTYCPMLVEERICGSMRNCEWSHFQFLKNNG